MVQEAGIELAVEGHQQHGTAAGHAAVEGEDAVHGRGVAERAECAPALDREPVHLHGPGGDPIDAIRHDAQEQAVEDVAGEVGHHQAEIDRLVIAGHQSGGLDIEVGEQPYRGAVGRAERDHRRAVRGAHVAGRIQIAFDGRGIGRDPAGGDRQQECERQDPWHRFLLVRQSGARAPTHTGVQDALATGMPATARARVAGFAGRDGPRHASMQAVNRNGWIAVLIVGAMFA
ncbi:MAG: hypothetical protein FIB01_00545, partial [Gemmatimonadetes bacterium]|nr:hypothetical protein [Gemmatimonadota bacterium]